MRIRITRESPVAVGHAGPGVTSNLTLSLGSIGNQLGVERGGGRALEGVGWRHPESGGTLAAWGGVLLSRHLPQGSQAVTGTLVLRAEWDKNQERAVPRNANDPPEKREGCPAAAWCWQPLGHSWQTKVPCPRVSRLLF